MLWVVTSKAKTLERSIMNGDKIGACPFCGCDVVSERTKGFENIYGDFDIFFLHTNIEDQPIWSAKHPFFHDKTKDNTCIGRNVNFQWFDTEEELIAAFNTRLCL